MRKQRILAGLSVLALFACSADPPPPQVSPAPPAAAPAVAAQAPAPEATIDASATEQPWAYPDGCQLTVGWDPYEPYTYADPTGEAVGIDIELVRLMASEAGCELAFVQEDWSVLMRDMRSGEVNLLTGATLLPQRTEFAYFSEPYRAETFALYLRAGEADRWRAGSIEELVGDPQRMRIGITDGYYYGEAVEQLLNDDKLAAQFVPAPNSEEHAGNLLEKRIDGMLEDPFVAMAMIKRKGLSERIAASGLKIETGEVNLMFSKASVAPQTVTAFNEALQAMRSDGRYDEIVRRHLQ